MSFKNINKILFISIIFLTSICHAGKEIVINALPSSVVYSSAKSTKREELKQPKQNEFSLLIIKKNGRYYWASRENKELFYTRSGVVHIFVEKGGAGYITIYDENLISGKKNNKKSLEYKEHIRNFNSNITYWGNAEVFSP